MKEQRCLLIVYAPVDAADAVRDAIVKAGGGRIGDYEACSFSTRGTARFRPLKGADPAVGEVGELTETEEERIEVLSDASQVKRIMDAVREVHPYEEPVMDVLQCLALS